MKKKYNIIHSYTNTVVREEVTLEDCLNTLERWKMLDLKDFSYVQGVYQIHTETSICIDNIKLKAKAIFDEKGQILSIKL